jgi:hypothetical protein
MKAFSTIGIAMVCIITLFSGISHAGSTGIIDSSHDLSRGSTGSQFKYATNRACVFCHTPHNANTTVRAGSFWNSTGYQEEVGTAPLLLWNRSIINGDTPPFKLYESSSGIVLTRVNVYSLLCLGCHDGVGALNVLQNFPSDGRDTTPPDGAVDWYINGAPFKPDQIGDVFDGGINIGERKTGGNTYVELRNDHPISVNYLAANAQDDDGFENPITAGGITYVGDPKVKLFNGFVECTSCHDPHNEGVQATGAKYPFLWVDNAGSYLCTRCHLK